MDPRAPRVGPASTRTGEPVAQPHDDCGRRQSQNGQGEPDEDGGVLDHLRETDQRQQCQQQGLPELAEELVAARRPEADGSELPSHMQG
jgi:hypothetical protein